MVYNCVTLTGTGTEGRNTLAGGNFGGIVSVMAGGGGSIRCLPGIT